MKKAALTILLFGLSVLSAMSQEKPVIALFPMQNPTGEGWIDTLGNTVEEVVSLTLALMGRYEIKRPGTLPSDMSEEGLLELAREKGYDDIILGECTLTDDGYRFFISNFDLYKEKITVRAEENFDSLLDSFDASDRLTEALVEGLSGVKVLYGGLTLALLRDEPYRTVIDDVDIGAGFSGSDKFIVGPHILRFFQDRGEGEELVAERHVEIKEGETLTLDSPIPWLSPSLAGELKALERRIAAEGDNEKRADLAEGWFLEARSLVDSEYYSLYRPELVRRYTAWEEMYRQAPADVTELENSSFRMKEMYLGHLPYNSLFAAPREPVGSNLGEGVALLETLRGVSMDEDYTVLPDTADIKVDGYADDWKDVRTVFQDDTGDLQNGAVLSPEEKIIDGQDLEWVGLAMDSEKLYIAVKTASGTFSRKRDYALEIQTDHLFRVYYRPREHRAAAVETPDKDWGRSRWFESSKYQSLYSAREILEFSVPWKRIMRFLDPADFTMKGRFMIQRDVDPWQQVDGFDFKLFIPDFYYRLRKN